MKELSRLSLYKQLLGKESTDYQYALNFNIALLSDIEDLFLTEDSNNQGREMTISVYELTERIRNNIDGIRNRNNFVINPNGYRTIKNVEKYLDNLSKHNNSVYNIFNKLLNELGIFNEKEVSRFFFTDKLNRAEKYKQIFLSHAYNDRLYTAALFEYFYQERLYLYIDWMHHDKYEDGRKLKKDLQNELRKSSQLFFIRTSNSELDIQGKHMIRSWCSWEMGSFYSMSGKDEKYLLNLYSVDNYNNILLHGLKLFSGIVSNKMDGRVITP